MANCCNTDAYDKASRAARKAANKLVRKGQLAQPSGAKTPHIKKAAVKPAGARRANVRACKGCR
jgi:hypothetical protein